MINADLATKIRSAHKKHRTRSLVLFSLFFLIASLILFYSGSWQYGLLVLAGAVVMLTVFSRGSDKALTLLLEEPHNIESIDIELVDGNIELEIQPQNQRIKYELKFPEQEGMEIADALKAQLSETRFIDKR